jgi:regulatory protein
MSRKELKDKLLQKGEDEDIAEYCVQWLADNGLLDDESYAASVARHYAAKGYGQGRVRTELSRRGINRELWADAVEQMPDNSNKLDKFIAARLKDPEDKAQVRKVTAALYRRGYSWEDIRSAMSRFNAQVEEEY